VPARHSLSSASAPARVRRRMLRSTPPQPAGDMIAGLYGLVSSTGVKLPDWDKIRACFLKEAVIVLRTSRMATTVFSLEGFIKDFVDFYERPCKRGERVADIGAGSGYFTIPVARAVGPTGVVWALDIAPEMLEYLDFRVKAQKVENIRLRKVLSDDPQLEPASIDTILMIDTIHYVKDRVSYAKKLRAGLAPGGRLVIIDYIPKPMSERPWGPPPEQQVPHRQMDADMAAAGLKVIRAYDFLPEQYFVVYGVPKYEPEDPGGGQTSGRLGADLDRLVLPIRTNSGQFAREACLRGRLRQFY